MSNFKHKFYVIRVYFFNKMLLPFGFLPLEATSDLLLLDLEATFGFILLDLGATFDLLLLDLEAPFELTFLDLRATFDLLLLDLAKSKKNRKISMVIK